MKELTFEDGWQPIETIPVAEMVIVWAPDLNRGLPSIGIAMCGSKDADGKPDSWWPNGGVNAGWDFDFEVDPTHWRVLPLSLRQSTTVLCG